MTCSLHRSVRAILSILAMACVLFSGTAHAATYTLAPLAYQTVLDMNGNPVSGAKICTYLAGTTTQAATFSDSSGTPNGNPIVADGAGRFVAYLAAGASYKFVFQDATGTAGTCNGVQIRVQDNIPAVPAATVNLDVTGTAGEALTAGQAVYLSAGDGAKAAGQWFKADSANAYSSSVAVSVGMVPTSIVSGAAGTIRLAGQMTGLSSLTLGTAYYVGTAGAITATAPVNARKIGEADTTSSLVIALPAPTLWSTITTTSTGTQNDFAPGLVGNTIIRANNATLLTIDGFSGGYDGQRIVIQSIGAGEVDLAHQNAGSSAANRLINFATSGVTPLAAGVGTAEYTYDATTARWRLTQHEQGTWIVPTTPTFSGNGSQTWSTVTVNLNRYMLRGRTLHIQFDFTGTVGGVANTLLQFTLANGYTAAANEASIYNGNLTTAAFLSATASSNLMGFFKDLTATGNFAAGTWRAVGGFVFEVQ